jgi:hypothetical protein
VAFGTPVAGAIAYSAQNGTSVSPSYPAGIQATDQLVLVVGMKPSTANSGTVTRADWTLRGSLTAAGGYGTTLGADTGNTNLWIFTKNTVTGSESGTLAVTLATNNVSWAFIVRIPTGGGAVSYGSSSGGDTTAGNVSVTLSANPGLTAGDLALWAMCIPTDITTPTQFSAHAITAAGATFATATEINEPDSGTGNDIGGFSAWTTVSSGTASAAPTVTATAGGTTTNVRGPLVLVRFREANVYVIDAQPDSFTYTGQTSELLYSRRLAMDAQSTSFTLTGQDAELIRTTAAQAYELDAQPGSFTLAGQDAKLAVVRSLHAQSGTFNSAGESSTLLRAYAGISEAGSYTLAGQDAELSYVKAAVIMDAQPGAFTLTGSDTTLLRNYALDAESGVFGPEPWVDPDWVDPDYSNGEAAILAYGRAMPTAAGVYTITGRSATMRVTGLTWPDPDDVRLGVQYGPTGIEYTGTLVAGVKIDVNSGRFIKPIGARGGIFV